MGRKIKARCEKNPIADAPLDAAWVAWTEGAGYHHRFVLFRETKRKARADLRQRVYDVLGSRYKVVFQEERG